MNFAINKAPVLINLILFDAEAYIDYIDIFMTIKWNCIRLIQLFACSNIYGQLQLEQLYAARGKPSDPYAVATLHNSIVVGHVPRRRRMYGRC